MLRSTSASLVVLVLVGCGSSDGGEPVPAMAADGTNVRTCHDLKCEVFVPSPVTFPID
ncbi:hypothetical protein AGRA3207_004245 [Actinomadura graeca]|uniref:Lipoprotein n=1 Tax=Actinomadura graeca TaxID=2750812 RepID=A0ABX8R0A1_9ACTN|nr:hypothetical protein [Actinomadura graeca]QXJ23127.1 hypothetical protein AGRA3207_004245 [Actinomadura graeca]